MKLEDIDKIFNNNQHQFDKMPSDKLWERLEEKLDATPPMWEEKPTPKVRWLRYVAAAAVILIMMLPAMYLIDGIGIAPQAHKNSSLEEHPIVAKVEKNESESIRSPKDTPSVDIAKEEKTLAKPIQETKISTNAKEETILRQYSLKDRDENKLKETSPTSYTRDIAKPAIKSAPKPITKKQSLPPPPPPASSNPSDEQDIAVKEESENNFSFGEAEIEEKTELEEAEISSYQAAPKAIPTSKKEIDAFQSSSGNINNINKIHADSRYNVDFDRRLFSNALSPDNSYSFEPPIQKQEIKKPTKNRKSSSKKIQAKKPSSNKVDASLALPSSDFLNNLEGNWVQYIEEKSYYETWTNSPNGTFMGTASTLQNGSILFKENISITPLQNGDLRYTIHHPQMLTLHTSSINTNSENLLIFENLQNNFPSKITYRLTTETMLEITFEGKKENQIIVKQLIMVKQQ